MEIRNYDKVIGIDKKGRKIYSDGLPYDSERIAKEIKILSARKLEYEKEIKIRQMLIKKNKEEK